MTVNYIIISILLIILQYHLNYVIIYLDHLLAWTKIIILGSVFFIIKPCPWLNKLSMSLIILIKTQTYSDNQIKSWASYWHIWLRFRFPLYLRKSRVRQNFELLHYNRQCIVLQGKWWIVLVSYFTSITHSFLQMPNCLSSLPSISRMLDFKIKRK